MSELPANQPVAYFCGRIVPSSAVQISPWDLGFVWGATVSERLRTFRGRLFGWEQHVERLRQSLAIVGIELPMGDMELRAAAEQVVAQNFTLLPAGSDLDVTLWATPGVTPGQPTICILTAPLRFERWSHHYELGVALVTACIRQVPASCWPAHLKCRSRMHYYLADRQASASEPGSQALLLDQQGCVTETSTANVLVVTNQGEVLSPPRETILPGISLACTRELCITLGLPFLERPINPKDLSNAAEVLLTSTSYCILPVTRFDGKSIGTGLPGPLYRRLVAAWQALTGLDLVGQAQIAAR